MSKIFNVVTNSGDEKSDIIVFSETQNGFDASQIEKTDDGIELDSAYIQTKDKKAFLKAIKKASEFGWFK